MKLSRCASSSISKCQLTPYLLLLDVSGPEGGMKSTAFATVVENPTLSPAREVQQR